MVSLEWFKMALYTVLVRVGLAVPLKYFIGESENSWSTRRLLNDEVTYKRFRCETVILVLYLLMWS